MPKHYEDELRKFLMRKENLSYALQIGDQLQEIRTEIFENFWRELKNQYEKKLSMQGIRNEWNLNFKLTDFSHDWQALLFQPKRHNDSDPVLRFAIEQGPIGSQYCFYYGLNWKDEQQNGYAYEGLSELRDLEELWENKGFTKNKWWLRYIFCQKYKSQNDFLISVNEDLEAEFESHFDEVCLFFEQLSPLLLDFYRAIEHY